MLARINNYADLNLNQQVFFVSYVISLSNYFFPNLFASASSVNSALEVELEESEKIALLDYSMITHFDYSHLHTTDNVALNKAMANFKPNRLKLKHTGKTKNPFMIEVSLKDSEIVFIKNALLFACNEKSLTRFLNDPSFKIKVVPQEIIASKINGDDADAMYYANDNTIYIAERMIHHLTPDYFDNLVTLLNNEFSHANAIQTADKKVSQLATRGHCANGFCLFGNTMIDSSSLNLPTIDPQEQAKLAVAYQQFEQCVHDFKSLTAMPHRKLNDEDKKRLIKYNRAMENYTPRRYFDGKNYHTAVEVSASLGIKNIKKANRLAFFDDFNNRNRLMNTAQGYQGLSSNRKLSEQISFFDELNPEAKQAFGKELCEELTQLHNLPYCSRPKIK